MQVLAACFEVLSQETDEEHAILPGRLAVVKAAQGSCIARNAQEAPR